MKQVGLYEAKTKLSALVAELEATGEVIALTRHGKVVAELTLPRAQVSPKAGMLASGGFHIADDFDRAESGFEDFFTEAEGTEAVSRRIAEDPADYRQEEPEA